MFPTDSTDHAELVKTLNETRDAYLVGLATEHGQGVADAVDAFAKSLAFLRVIWPAIASAKDPQGAHEAVINLCSDFSQDMLSRLCQALALNEAQIKLAMTQGRSMNEQLIKLLENSVPKIITPKGPTVQ